MKLYIDKESNQFITEPTFKTPVNTVSFKRGDAAKVEIVFVESNTALSATNGKNIIFGIKQTGKYDGALVVSTSAYTVSGNSYILRPSFNTESLNSLLSSGDDNDSNDVAALNAMLEITWSDDGTDWFSSNTITAVINNDVIKGTEGTPVELQSPESWFDNRLSAVYTQPSNLSLAPVNESLSSFRVRVPSLSFDVPNCRVYETDATGHFRYSNAEAGDVSSLSGQSSIVYFDPLFYGWYVENYQDGVYVEYYTGAINSHSPIYGDWALDVSFSDIVYSEPFTQGTLGQIVLVDPLTSFSSNEVFICVDSKPSTWRKINLV